MKFRGKMVELVCMKQFSSKYRIHATFDIVHFFRVVPCQFVEAFKEYGFKRHDVIFRCCSDAR